MDMEMSVSQGLNRSMIEKAYDLKQQIESIIFSMPDCELYQLQTRMSKIIEVLPEQMALSFEKETKIAKIRGFIEIVGNLQECKDYLELLQKIKYTDYSEAINKIDNITESLMVNSGSLN
jgi:hypothetical protein